MTITRCGLHEELEHLDAEIAEAQKHKSAAFDAYREQLEADGHTKAEVKNEIAAFKIAERKLRALSKNANAVLEKDALVDEIIGEIRSGTPRATRIPAPRTRPPVLPIDADATGSPRHVVEPAPLPRPPALPGAGSSFAEGTSKEPASREVSTPLGEIEPDREAGLHAGSPLFSEPDPRDDIRNYPGLYRGAVS